MMRLRLPINVKRLEGVLHSEISSLGNPRAALLALGVAVLAYKVLAVLWTALRVKHKLIETSRIKPRYADMMIAVLQPYE